MFQTEDGWRRRVTVARPGFHCCHGHVLVTSTQATESLGPVLPFELAYTLHDSACGLHSLGTATKKTKKRRFFWYDRSSGWNGILSLICLFRHTFGKKKKDCRPTVSTRSCLSCKSSGVGELQSADVFARLDLQSRNVTIKTNQQNWNNSKGLPRERTSAWKVLECWPLCLTSPNMFPQAIPQLSSQHLNASCLTGSSTSLFGTSACAQLCETAACRTRS